MPHNDTMHQSLRFSMALFFVLIATMQWLEIDMVLGAFIAGIFISNFFAHKKELPHQLSMFGFGFLVPLFFIFVGTTLDLNLVFTTHILTHASSSDTMEIITDTLKAYFKYQQLSTLPLTAATIVRWHNCAKTIFQVGAPITNNLTVNVMQPTTLTLDIIPITHPQQLTTNSTSYTCEFQVNFNGTALTNQIIEVWHSNAASPQKLTTNRKGRVTVTIAKGHYMLTTYHSLLATNTPKPIVEAYFGSLTLSTPKGNIFLKRSSKN